MDEPEAALAFFGVAPLSIAVLSGGMESVVWRVEADERTFTLRRYDPAVTPLARIAAELAWLEALSESDPAVAPRPIRRTDGRLAPAETRGHDAIAPALWTVLTWVDGAPLGRLPTNTEARATGEMLAAMHARKWMPSDGGMLPSYDADLFRHAAIDLFANVPVRLGEEERAVVDGALALACSNLDRLWRGGVGVVHADLHDGNLMWTQGSQYPTAIDFGRCGLAPLALDVAMAQHYVTPELAAELLAGYIACGGVADAATMTALRFLAAVENLAVLSHHSVELDAVVADIPWLVEQATQLKT